VDRDSSNSEDR